MVGRYVLQPRFLIEHRFEGRKLIRRMQRTTFLARLVSGATSSATTRHGTRCLPVTAFSPEVLQLCRSALISWADMVLAPSGAGLFKWRQFEPEMILLAVGWYLRFSLSHRDVEELLAERGLSVDQVTIWRWCGATPQNSTGDCAGYEVMHMIRKGQACWSAAGVKVGLLHRFVVGMLGIEA